MSIKYVYVVNKNTPQPQVWIFFRINEKMDTVCFDWVLTKMGSPLEGIPNLQEVSDVQSEEWKPFEQRLSSSYFTYDKNNVQGSVPILNIL